MPFLPVVNSTPLPIQSYTPFLDIVQSGTLQRRKESPTCYLSRVFLY
jgi:hypothetical protein